MSSEKYNERLQRARSAKKISVIKNIEEDVEANITDVIVDMKQEDAKPNVTEEVMTQETNIKKNVKIVNTNHESVNIKVDDAENQPTVMKYGRPAVNMFERKLVNLGKKIGVQVVFD